MTSTASGDARQCGPQRGSRRRAMSDATMIDDLDHDASPRPHLDHRPHFASLIGFLAVLLGGILFAAFSISGDMAASASTAWRSAPSSCSNRAADRARLRVRQRLPRHRQRGRHGDLYPQPAAAGGRDLVGHLQLPRRADLQRRGRLHRRHPAAGGTDPAGRQRRRLRDDLRPADRRDHLEPRHLGAWACRTVPRTP